MATNTTKIPFFTTKSTPEPQLQTTTPSDWRHTVHFKPPVLCMVKTWQKSLAYKSKPLYEQVMNKNDKIIEKKDLTGQMDFGDFKYRDKLIFLCDLIPEQGKERLVIQNPDTGLIKKKGVLYALVLDNKLIKIGSATTSFKDRVGSYNCGRNAYRNKGTCSTTNYFVLQSLLKINEPVKVFGYFPKEIKIDVFGEKEKISLPAKRFEKKILRELKQKGKLPVLCTQQ